MSLPNTFEPEEIALTYHFSKFETPPPAQPATGGLDADRSATEAKWGPCHSCGCRGFKSRPQKDDICGECGHHWEMHY